MLLVARFSPSDLSVTDAKNNQKARNGELGTSGSRRGLRNKIGCSEVVTCLEESGCQALSARTLSAAYLSAMYCIFLSRLYCAPYRPHAKELYWIPKRQPLR